MRRTFHLKFNLFLLALTLALLAPARFAPGPSSSMALLDDPCVVVRDCCAKMAACCCEIAPTRPAPPADLAGAEMLSPAPKFVATKDGGKLVVQNLAGLGRQILPAALKKYRLPVMIVAARPLYILNRALLI